mgnify:CR=1 FL=1
MKAMRQPSTYHYVLILPERTKKQLQTVRRELWRMTGDVAFYAASGALPLAFSNNMLEIPASIPWDGSSIEIESRVICSAEDSLILPAAPSNALQKLTTFLVQVSGAHATSPCGLLLAPQAKDSFLVHQVKIEQYIASVEFSPISDARLAVLELEQSHGGWRWQFFQPKRLAVM